MKSPALFHELHIHQTIEISIGMSFDILRSSPCYRVEVTHCDAIQPNDSISHTHVSFVSIPPVLQHRHQHRLGLLSAQHITPKLSIISCVHQINMNPFQSATNPYQRNMNQDNMNRGNLNLGNTNQHQVNMNPFQNPFQNPLLHQPQPQQPVMGNELVVSTSYVKLTFIPEAHQEKANTSIGRQRR